MYSNQKIQQTKVSQVQLAVACFINSNLQIKLIVGLLLFYTTALSASRNYPVSNVCFPTAITIANAANAIHAQLIKPFCFGQSSAVTKNDIFSYKANAPTDAPDSKHFLIVCLLGVVLALATYAMLSAILRAISEIKGWLKFIFWLLLLALIIGIAYEPIATQKIVCLTFTSILILFQFICNSIISIAALLV